MESLSLLYRQYKSYYSQLHRAFAGEESSFPRVFRSQMTLNEFEDWWDEVCESPELEERWRNRFEEGFHAHLEEAKDIGHAIFRSERDAV